MSATIGILLDVSGSMHRSVGELDSEEGGPWTRSLFQVIDDLIKHDLSSENKVFALAFGANCEKTIFDILRTVEKFQNNGTVLQYEDFPARYSLRTFGQSFIYGVTPFYRSNRTVNKFQNKGIILPDEDIPATDEHIKEVFKILERHGAYTIRKWASACVVRSAVRDDMITLVLSQLKSNETFRDHFVNSILPPACRNWVSTPQGFGPLSHMFSFFSNQVQNAYAMVGSNFKQATEEDVRELVEKVKPVLLERPDEQSVLSVHEASEIMHGCTGNKELSDERSRKLHRLVKPFIYGGTPLYESLKISEKLFRPIGINKDMRKVLFVLSDGKPGDIDISDERAISKIKNDLFVQDITVVCCFISDEKVTHPKKLYSSKKPGWSGGASFLFSLSSTVSTQVLPRAILLKRGWDIDISNNETKLFMQVNHPENVREACDLARSIVCNQEALSELLVSVSLDMYINQTRAEFRAPAQEGGTCYANASATVLHLSMKRILGRDNGYPDFGDLRKELILRHGTEGAYTLGVLQEVCPKYRLHCQKVNLKGALQAITGKRPVVATFRLTDPEWYTFSSFYRDNPTGVLSKGEMDITKRRCSEELSGHAVVLTSFNSQFLRLMNSWGDNWGDMGFFRIESADVLDLQFIDVYWTLNDLSAQEKEYYERHGSNVSDKLMNSLIGLQRQTYTCPLCNQNSPVTTFTGTLHRAKCPWCEGVFSSNGAGNILALNMYLTSLTR